MPQHRAYQLDEGGHVTGRIGLTCTDDEGANRRAAQFLDGRDIELWQEARRVSLFKAKGEGPG
jgi:hypothetical protein